MRLRNHKQASSKSGFTLLEVSITSAIMLVVGIGLTQGLDMAQGSHTTVNRTADMNQDLRGSFRKLRNEVKSSTDTRISVSQSANTNATVTLQVPIEAGAAAGWGAVEHRLGATEAEWNRADWFITYTVETNVAGSRQLLRRVIDLAGNTQWEEVLATNVRSGDHADGPGFSMNKVGDVWVLDLAIEEQNGNGKRSETMHVRTRN